MRCRINWEQVKDDFGEFFRKLFAFIGTLLIITSVGSVACYLTGMLVTTLFKIEIPKGVSTFENNMFLGFLFLMCFAIAVVFIVSIYQAIDRYLICKKEF